MRGLVIVGLLYALVRTASAEEIYPGYSWRALSDGIYLHAQIDPLAGPVDGNSVVILNDDGVLVVDTHINPAVARAVIGKIRTITDRPVTHVVNTHWHDDHTNGNHAYRRAFPDVRIVAHERTLAALRNEWPAMEDQRRQAYADVDVEALRQSAIRLDQSDPAAAIGYRLYADYVAALKPELPTLALEYPDTVFEDRLELEFGNRRVELRWLGRGNTDGDIVVWLPDERLLITGDMLVAPIPFAFDSPMGDWARTLDRLAALDAALIVPGHGPVQTDNRYLARVRALLEATLDAVRQAHDRGVAHGRLADEIDLTAYEEAFTGNDPERAWAWRAYYVRPGVQSAWLSLGYEVPEE